MRANMPKMSTKAHGSKRKKVICFDLQGPFKPSSSGYRYCVNFYCIDHATHLHREIRHWHVDFLRSKDEFPDRLEDFLNSGESESGWQQYQLFTDNEYVLNSNEVKTMIKVRRMKTIRNSCEYEPYQNGAVERSWRTLTAGGREFLLRGFDMGDCEDGNEFEACEYWTYAVMQSAHAYNASFSTAERKGRISHLRVP